MIPMDVRDDYFEWMFELACRDKYDKNNSYRELLSYLHEVEFKYRIRGDIDRAYDGVALRRRYALRIEECDYSYIMECLQGPCSVLEMMLALAIRCEEEIMDDPQVGDRTRQWFWKMIVNLGLGSMIDSRYDQKFVEKVIRTFLGRRYEPDGRGGLFIIRNCDYDLRGVSIWTQAMWYLDTMI